MICSRPNYKRLFHGLLTFLVLQIRVSRSPTRDRIRQTERRQRPFGVVPFGGLTVGKTCELQFFTASQDRDPLPFSVTVEGTSIGSFNIANDESYAGIVTDFLAGDTTLNLITPDSFGGVGLSGLTIQEVIPVPEPSSALLHCRRFRKTSKAVQCADGRAHPFGRHSAKPFSADAGRRRQRVQPDLTRTPLPRREHAAQQAGE